MVGKVIKKLVKKKVFKLGLTGASLIGLMISSGFSFAKYIDTNYGSGGAGAARFGAKVIYEENSIQLPNELNEYYEGVYAFITSFRVDFTECEVKCKYNINIKLSNENNSKYTDDSDLDITYFTLGSSQTVYTFSSSSGSLEKEEAPSLNWNMGYSSFATNTFYYAMSVNNTTYNWYSYSSTNLYINSINNLTYDFTYDVYYFKVLYFVDFTEDSMSHGLENSKLFYYLDMEQVM